MFRLKATLVVTTRMRPWRTGWSENRGVDFSLGAAIRPARAPATARGDAPAPERACFVDEAWIVPPGATVARRFDRLAATDAAIEPSPGDAAETAGLRAWWSVSGKTSRT